jgi:hypothetical protein
LYYLRDRVGKAARLKQVFTSSKPGSAEALAEGKAKAAKAEAAAAAAPAAPAAPELAAA